MSDYDRQRAILTDELRRDERHFDDTVLNAIGKVPRHCFIPENLRSSAYENHALPIGMSQTISQPFVVAFMTQSLRLKPSDRVLEIGTGSGYQAAVMSLIASEIYTVEIIPELGKTASVLFRTLVYPNIHVRVADGYYGWQEEAPFDAIVLTAAPKRIPQMLFDQLRSGGRLIAPVGKDVQKLILFEKDSQVRIRRRNLLDVIFVPMTGEAEK